MRPILSGPIAAAIIQYAVPEQLAKEPGNGALEAGNFSAAGTSSEDETPPDYGDLAKKYGDGESTETVPVVTPTPEPKVEQPPAKVEPVTPTPPAEPAAKKDHPHDPKRYDDGTFKPGQKSDADEPFPDIEPLKPRQEGKPKEAAKAPEPAKPAAKPPEVTPVPAVKPTEPKPGEAKKLPADDADIDALEPKPTASDKTKNDFKALKEVAKTARSYAREVEAKLAEAEKKVAAELPDDVKAKLATADEDRKFREIFELENEPKARAEYSTKLTGAEDKILKTLTEDARLKLPQAKADELKKVGFDSAAGVKMRNEWFALIRKNTGDEMLVQEVAGLFRDRQKVIADRASEVEALRGNRDEYLKKRQEGEKNEFNQWGTEADKTLINLSKGHDWTEYMAEIPNATPEQKAVVDAHNARVKNEIVPAFNSAVLDVFNRKPAETVSHVFDSMRLKYEVQPKLDEAAKEIETLKARIAELEPLANGVRQVSQVSRAEDAPAGQVKVAPHGIEGAGEPSADEALDKFLADKQKR